LTGYYYAITRQLQGMKIVAIDIKRKSGDLKMLDETLFNK
jgi:hypothetical protein